MRPFKTKLCKRMAEQALQRGGRKIFLDRIHEKNQQGGSTETAERFAGGIINPDVPARKI